MGFRLAWATQQGPVLQEKKEIFCLVQEGVFGGEDGIVCASESLADFSSLGDAFIISWPGHNRKRSKTMTILIPCKPLKLLCLSLPSVCSLQPQRVACTAPQLSDMEVSAL